MGGGQRHEQAAPKARDREHREPARRDVRAVPQVEQHEEHDPQPGGREHLQRQPVVTDVVAVLQEQEADEQPGGEQREREVQGPAVHRLQPFEAEHRHDAARVHLVPQPPGLDEVHDAGEEPDADADRREQDQRAVDGPQNRSPLSQAGTSNGRCRCRRDAATGRTARRAR